MNYTTTRQGRRSRATPWHTQLLQRLSLLLLLLTSLNSWAAVPNEDSDPNYSEKVITSGSGWKLVETRGLDETGGEITGRLYMVDGSKGLADVPLPDELKESLIDDLAASEVDDEPAYIISESVVSEIQRSLAQGKPTAALLAMDEAEGSVGQDSAGRFLGCKDRFIDKSKHFAINAPLNRDFAIADGFTGNVSLTGTARVDADGAIRIKLKRTRLLAFLGLYCVPYAVKLDHARVWGTALIDQGATISGTVSYSNPKAIEWLIAKPKLFSFDFMAGPIPVHVGFKLPITAGIDKNGINASVTGSVTYSGRRSVSGYLDYRCTPKACTGNASFDTTNLGSQPLTGSISGRFQPSIYAQVAVRGYLYGDDVAYAQVGVRPYLHGDLWGYYGNNCGDSDGNSNFETVDALTFDMDWQLYITAQANTFLTKEWRKNLWISPRWHVGFWNLLGASRSTALTPMLEGPAVVPVNVSQSYTARMRPCWPYTDNMSYALAWGDGTMATLSGPAAGAATATHAWTQIGAPKLTLTAVKDAHGRYLGRNTSREVVVTRQRSHKGMTWLVLERNGSYTRVGADTLTQAYLGDTEPTASLPILCLKKQQLTAPPGIPFNFYSGWSGGSIKLSAPVRGLDITSRAVADNICASTFGFGYRMGEFHDGKGGWSWWGQGVLSGATRFWVAINDQLANPWN